MLHLVDISNINRVPIYGDNVRFQELHKTCDILKPHNNIYHDYRYPISYKNAKRGKSDEPIFPMITRKHNNAKFGYGGDMIKIL
jgi:hypothetical protein